LVVVCSVRNANSELGRDIRKDGVAVLGVSGVPHRFWLVANREGVVVAFP
jgi:hypothetical protein